MTTVSGVVSRQVLPACGSLCFCCPSLRTRSRQPVKRYKKLIADIFPRNQVSFFCFLFYLLFGCFNVALVTTHCFTLDVKYVISTVDTRKSILIFQFIHHLLIFSCHQPLSLGLLTLYNVAMLKEVITCNRL